MKVVLPALLALLSTPAMAQTPEGANDMLKRIFASSDFAQQRFGPARWIENGTAYTTLERSDAVTDGFDIVRYETATGNKSVYISARQLVPAGNPYDLSVVPSPVPSGLASADIPARSACRSGCPPLPSCRG